MKHALALSISFLAACASAQYSIDWHKVAGGGGTSSNDQFLIRGTIGQHDAGGPLTGGNYSLTGGFWAVAAVQASGAPRLRLFLTATNTVVVAWPAPSAGFRLQQNTSLDAANWSNVTDLMSVVNGENQVTVPPSVGNRFYRLANP